MEVERGQGGSPVSYISIYLYFYTRTLYRTLHTDVNLHPFS